MKYIIKSIMNKGWLKVLPFYLFTLLPLHAQRMDDLPVHSKYIQAVDEYRPAPGQYINDVPEYETGDTEADMIRKCRCTSDSSRRLGWIYHLPFRSFYCQYTRSA